MAKTKDNTIEAIQLLGMRAADKVTGFTGTVSSVTFDLYGCVQVILTPPVGKDGKPGDSHWFDVKRLKLSTRIMPVPDFAGTKFGEENGAAERPRSMPRGY